MEKNMNKHIDNKTLAAFLDDALEGSEKKDVLNHLRCCDECRLKMAETSIFIQEMKKEEDEIDEPVAASSGISPVNNPWYKVLKYASLPVAAGIVAIFALPYLNLQKDYREPATESMKVASIPDDGYYDEEIETASAVMDEEVITEEVEMTAAEPMYKESLADIEAKLQTVYFEKDTYTLSPEMKQVIVENNNLIRHTDYTIILEGNADDNVSVEYGYALALKRAKEVKEFLLELGMDEQRITMTPYSNENPICVEKTPECSAQNRRVDFMLRP